MLTGPRFNLEISASLSEAYEVVAEDLWSQEAAASVSRFNRRGPFCGKVLPRCRVYPPTVAYFLAFTTPPSKGETHSTPEFGGRTGCYDVMTMPSMIIRGV